MSDDNDIIKSRREKIERWRAGGNAYSNAFRRKDLAAQLHERCDGLDKPELERRSLTAQVAGRVRLRRVMGKASFITIGDVSGQIQAYIRKDEVGEDAYTEFDELWDIGDLVGVTGTVMRTNKGELTVQASHIELLNKTLRPLPEKYHGLADQEIKYRQRYLDLIMNDSSRELFQKRTQVVQCVRQFFLQRDYLEVETPMMHTIPGGATARPFSTYHNALDMELYLRIAPELFLKRLVVGGFERVFEINRSFRNEGLSARHNPEFTMLEFYQAYSDYQELMTLTEELLKVLSVDILGGEPISLGDTAVDLGSPIRRMTMAESLVAYTPLSASDVDDEGALRASLQGANLALQDNWGAGKLQMELFEARVEDTLTEPTFITEYPAEVSPLARRNDSNSAVTDRFELFIGGREYANGFSELNDPEDQAERFRQQVLSKDAGDREAMHYDQDYIDALEYGLPPTAGEGIGIDRLVMLLTGAASIRDVLLFPLMRPKDH